MRTRSTWVAWSMLAIFIVGCGVAVTLELATGDFGQDAVALYLAFTAFMVVGAVIVAHRPGNVIGWIFSAIGLLAATGTLAMEYAAYATRPGSLPAAIWAAWYQQQWWIPMFAIVFVATPLLFPTGRLPSARWRPVAAVAAVTAVALELLVALQPTIKLQDENYRIDIPSGWPGSPTLKPARSAAPWRGCSLPASWGRSSPWCCGSAAPGGWSASSSSGWSTPACCYC